MQDYVSFDFSGLTQTEWEQLDIPDVVGRYAQGVIPRCERTWDGAGHDYVSGDDLVSEFYLVAIERVRSAHKRNLEAQGEQRTRCIVGTLNSIRSTAFRARLGEIQSLPSVHLGDDDGEDDATHIHAIDHFVGTAAAAGSPPSAEGYCYAAELTDLHQSTLPPDQLIHHDSGREDDEVRLSMMLEQMRSEVTPRQHRVLHQVLFAGRNMEEIGHDMGVTRQTISSLRAAAYRKLDKLRASCA